MLGDEPAQLVLERVVVGVGDERIAAVVGVAQRDDPGGEVLDALAGLGAHASLRYVTGPLRRRPAGRHERRCGQPNLAR